MTWVPTHTVGYFIKGNMLLLGLHQRGVSKGFWNGYGGKIDEGETVHNSLIRECSEESGLIPLEFNHVARVSASYGNFQLRVEFFLVSNFDGVLVTTDEMIPQWFDLNDIPYDKMWTSDELWLPRVLTGERLRTEVIFDKDRKILQSNVMTLNKPVLY